MPFVNVKLVARSLTPASAWYTPYAVQPDPWVQNRPAARYRARSGRRPWISTRL